MALTLSCSCSADVSICNLTQLIWRVQVLISANGPIGASGEITLFGLPGSAATIFLNNPPGVYDFAFDLTPLHDWINPHAGFGMDSSLWQVCSGCYYTIGAVDSIDQIYQCINITTGSTIQSVKQGPTTSVLLARAWPEAYSRARQAACVMAAPHLLPTTNRSRHWTLA